MTSPIRAVLKAIVPPAYRPRLKAAFYAGSRFECPICGTRVRKFVPASLPFQVLYDLDVIGGGHYSYCPFCNGVDRERLLYLYLSRKTDFFDAHHRILHIAPEKGIDQRQRQSGNKNYLTADLYEPNVMVKMDITNIQYPDASFDIVICNHVLEHIPDDRKAMRELFRVLRPGGWGILQVPLSMKLTSTYEDPSITTDAGREQAFGQADHVRIYAMDYLDRLRETGFEIDSFLWTSEVDDFGTAQNRYGLNPRESVYRVRKL
jgi:SAM-dependent methyltransferase